MQLLVQFADWLKAALLWAEAWPLAFLFLAFTFATAVVCQKLGVMIVLYPKTRVCESIWPEKARLAYPLWIFVAICPAIVAGVALVFRESLNLLSGGRLGASIDWLHWLSAFLGASLVSTAIESALKKRAISVADWFRDLLVVLLILLPTYTGLLSVGLTAPDHFGPDIWLTILTGVVVFSFCQWDGTLLIGRVLRFVLPPPERLQRAVQLAAERTGIHPKRVYALRWKAANACAFPLTGRIAVSDTFLRHCDDAELVAVCIHELAHLAESRRVKFLRVLGDLCWLPLILVKPILGTFGLPVLALVILLVLFARRLVRRLARRMEERADSISRTNEGEPGSYARALEHLYELNLMPAVLAQNRLTHPHLYDRMIAAGVLPPYERPRPPSRFRSWVALAAAAVFAIGLNFAMGLCLAFILK